MKKITNMISLFLSVLIICTTLVLPVSASGKVDESKVELPTRESTPSTSSTDETQKTPNVSSAHNHYYGKQLDTPQERQLYSVIEKELLTNKKSTTSKVKFNPPLKLTSGLNPNDDKAVYLDIVIRLQRALDAFKMDHPEFYWITGGSTIIDSTIRVYEDGNLYLDSAAAYFELGETRTFDEDKINKAVNIIVAEANKKTTDFDRIQVVHNMLAKTITYGNIENTRSYQIVGGLVDGTGTCESYSKNFKLIMDKLGYENIIVAGTGYSKGKAIPHMWNQVKLGDKWYAVDITWDDQKIILHDYFLAGENTVAPNFGDRTFGQDHVKEYKFSYLDYKDFTAPQLNSTGYGR